MDKPGYIDVPKRFKRVRTVGTIDVTKVVQSISELKSGTIDIVKIVQLINELKSGTLDVIKNVTAIQELKSGTVDVLKTVQTIQDYQSTHGTISAGPVTADVPSGTLDASGFGKTTLTMQARDVDGSTINVVEEIQTGPGTMWGSLDTITVKNPTGAAIPVVKTINTPAQNLRTVPKSSGTLDVTWRGRV